MKDLKIQETDTGFALFNLPYELKDAFKKIFKTAKWNATMRCWTVGVRAKIKLTEFVEHIQKDVEQLNLQKEEEETEKLTEQQINILDNELENLRKNITDAKQTNLIFTELAEKLAIMKEEKIKLTEELKKEKETTVKTVESIIDVEKIKAAFSDVKHYYKKLRSEDKYDYYAAISEIEGELEKLNKSGLTSPVLKKICKFNWNRKFRDNPFEININDMYKIVKLNN